MAMVRALQAESLKMKRTLAFWLAILIPLMMAGLQFVVSYQRGTFVQFDGQSTWVRFIQETLVFWSLLMLPLFVTLETALLAGLEHANQQWKHLFALPISRRAIYAAKQIAGMVLIGLSLLALLAFTLLAGLLLRATRPALGFGSEIPWAQALARCGVVYLSSWLIISLHTWVGLRWRSFVVAVAVGIVMTVSGMIVVNSDWGRFYPWALPGLIANGFSTGTPFPLAEMAFGGLGGVVVALIGGWEMTRRDVL
jgi:hypothetical protein